MSGVTWQIGDHVLVRGRQWTIHDATAWSDATLLRLRATIDRAPARALLTPFDRPLRLARPSGTQVVRPRRWLHELRRIGAEMAPYGGAVAVPRSAVRLLRHQIEPLLAVLRLGATRLLIADMVGLGKTIQAGLILLELAARVDEFRAIVLVPAGLRTQWRQELRDRFALIATETDAAWLRAAAAGRPGNVNPWSLPGIYLASIDFVKRPEVLRALEDVSWDVAVVDEAHQASASSDRRRAADAIASRSTRVVLLTATPDTGDPAAFAALAGIGALDASERPPLYFRRLRAEVSDGPARRSRLLRVQPTAAEQRMHELLDRYAARVWVEAACRGDVRAKLATIVLRKRALSSAASLAISAQRRFDLLAGLVSPHTQLLLPLAEEDPLTDDVADQDLAAPGLADIRHERRWLASIVEAARQGARAESKASRLRRWLARVREPVIVFTEYRDTMHRLERLLRTSGRPWITLHGGMERGERSRVQAAFNAGGLSLLATDAAAEGLNLHQHCRVVIHYELPWRPARIEQRVGRVDRLGQTRRVHEIALIAAGTAERLVLAPLAARVARARAAGDAGAGFLDSLSEAAVSELVMGGRLPPATSSPGPPPGVQVMDLRGEAAVEVARLEAARRWSATSPARRQDAMRRATVAAAIRARGRDLRPGLVLVFSRTLTDADGRRVHAEPSVVCLEIAAGWPFTRSAAALRRLVEEVQGLAARPGTVLHGRLTHNLGEMLRGVSRLRAAAHGALRLREERLRHAQPSAAREMVQAGLFDRRAVAAQARRSTAHRDQLAMADARIRSLERGAELIAGVDLVAALMIRRGAG